MKSLSFDAYYLKWFAIIAMLLNHIAIAFYSVLPFAVLLPIYAIGGLTYTIMAYFIVEGYRYTSNLRKYILRIFVFGVIAQAFHGMALGATALITPILHLNIMFTIILALLVLLMYDKIKIRFFFWVLFIIACVISVFMDLYFVAILMPLLYYAIKDENRRRIIPGIVGGLLFFILTLPMLLAEFMPDVAVYVVGVSSELAMAGPSFAIGCFIGAVLVKNFNNERGKRSKWLFYIFYPLHLAILAVIGIAIGTTEFSLFGF
jgi:hypothetical protein